MPITFTTGLKPTFPVDSFGSEKEHVKQIFTLLDNENAYVNVLETPLTNLISRYREISKLISLVYYLSLIHI